MNDHAVPPDIREVDPLHNLSARIRAGNAPAPTEIEHALEVGFGRLMGLEADLARVRKQPAAAPGTACGAGELEHRIEVLRDALEELRTLSSSSAPPWIGYGFVLPGQKPVGQVPRSPRESGRPRRS
jgi:hypothetical protein